MKRVILVLILANTALLLWQCRKKSADNVNIAYSKICNIGSFTNSLNQGEHPADMLTLPDNTVAILSTYTGTAFIRNYDTHGREMSMLKIPLANNALAMNILMTPDGGYVISSATIDFANHMMQMPGGYNYYFVNSLLNPCDMSLSFTSFSVPFNSKENKSKSYITRIDAGGNIKWTKVYDGNYYTGSSLAYSANNTLVFMATKSNLSFRIDSTTGTNNNLISNYADRNTVYLYNLDMNGNIKWNREFDSITGIGFNGQGSDPIYQGNVKANAHNILIQSGYTVLLLDNAGNMVSKPDIKSDLCTVGNYNQNHLFSAALDSAAFYVFEPVFETFNGQVTGHINQYDLKGTLVNYFTTGLNTTGLNTTLYNDGQGGLIVYDGFTFLKYDMYGRPLFVANTNSLSTGVAQQISDLAIRTCDGGYLVSSGTDVVTQLVSTDPLQLIKMDKTGQF